MKRFVVLLAAFAALVSCKEAESDNALILKKIEISTPKAEALPALFAQQGVEYNVVETLNWEKFPYLPAVKVAAAYTDDALLFHWHVIEDDVRAFVGEDSGPVWQDSCMEFFSMPAADSIYYNIECNCLGHILMQGGKAGTRRPRAPQEALDGIDRWSSLGTETFDERFERTEYDLCLVVPLTTFWMSEVDPLQGRTISANFYKCGGSGEYEHYVSLYPIDTPKPDFHRPEFFQEIRCECFTQ